jgi:uncharacterized protein involved in exopolysaccharide biosynthesis
MRSEGLAIEQYIRRPAPTLRDIVTVPFRQGRAMLCGSALAIIAVIVSGMWIPKYDAHMKILVRRERSDAMVTTSAAAPNQVISDQVSEEDLNTEVELLNSEDLLRKVVLQTGLGAKATSPGDPGFEAQTTKATLGLAKALKIEPLHKSNVISVRYQSRDPQKAAEVLAALATAYTQKHLEMHRASGEFKFFDQQMLQYKQGLNLAQEQLANFTKRTGVVSAEFERDSALRQANEFDTTARQAQTEVIETEQRVSALEAKLHTMQPRMTTVVRTSDNPMLLQQLKSTLLTLELKRTELLSKYDPQYRPVQEVEQQIADANRSIKAEESRPLRDETTDQDPDYLWVRNELTKAQAELIGLKARATAASAIAERYHNDAKRLDESDATQQDLHLAAKTQEQNYLLYAQKREEARISDALDERGILNVALAENPVAPALPVRSPLNAAIFALLLIGTCSFCAAYAVDFMDPSFRTPDELASYLDAPVLAALPKGD